MSNFHAVSTVAFPAFSGINISMMPFVIGETASIPEEFHAYLPMIEACPLPDAEAGQVGYLTIDERYVAEGSHRRGGIHTEGFGSVSWGGGGWGATNGLYMANSVPQSCALYDARIEHSGKGGEVTDAQIAGVAMHAMDAEVLYWMHDRTPHASLPVTQTERQFFRLVTSDVSVWYVDHSTPNRLGVQPRGQMLYGSKFN